MIVCECIHGSQGVSAGEDSSRTSGRADPSMQIGHAAVFFLSIHADYFIAILITPDDNSGKSALEHLEMGGGLNN